MERVYTNNELGKGISTIVLNKINNKFYVVSTAKDPRGPWQSVVFKEPENIHNAIPGPISETFNEAEKIHFKLEEVVESFPEDTWVYKIINYKF